MELDILALEYNLGSSSGIYVQMTGRKMIDIEEVLMKEQPDMLPDYEDINSLVW